MATSAAPAPHEARLRARGAPCCMLCAKPSPRLPGSAICACVDVYGPSYSPIRASCILLHPAVSHGTHRRCEACRQLTRAKKCFRVAVAPRVLTIHLKRFSFDAGGGPVKISSHVGFAPTLDLAPFMVGAGTDGYGPCLYRLCAVLVHEGSSTHSGHYFAYARSMALGSQSEGGGGSSMLPPGGPHLSDGGQWWLFNDSSVRRVGEGEALNASAYILLYEKVDGKRDD